MPLPTRPTALAAWLLAMPSLACNAPDDVFQAARLVPDTVDVAIAVDDAAELRRSPLGVDATGLVNALADFSETSQAWDGLAQQLGYDQSEAFDRLLGERFIFAARRTEAPAWIIVSVISRETEQRLRERLRPAPRQFVAGLPLLAVENGRFELILARTDTGTLLALAPSGAQAGALLEEVGPTLAKGGPGAPLAAAEPIARARALSPDPDVLAYARRTDKPGVHVVGVGTRGDDAMKISFLARTPDMPAPLGNVKPWSLTTFDAVARGAYAVIVEWDAMPAEFRLLPRVNLGPLTQMLRPAADDALVRGRTLAALVESDDGPFDLAVAMQTPDVTALAVDGDRRVADFLQRLSGQDTPRRDFAGVAPEAVRTVDLTGVLGPLEALGWARAPQMAWNYRAGGIAEAGDTAGWWTLGLGGGAVERVSAALAAPDDPQRRGQWLSVGMVRPADLLTALGRRGAPVPKVVEPLRWVGRVEWRTLQTPDGVIQGEASVRLTRPAP